MSNADEPAFATPAVTGLPNGGFEYGNPGLSKRELLAAMAMQSLLSQSHATSEAQIPMLLQKCSELSVKAADALLTELEKPR